MAGAAIASVVVLVPLAVAGAATPKVGTTCRTTELNKVVGGLVCKKVGSRRLWQRVPVATTTVAARPAEPTTAPAPVLTGKLTIMAPAPLKSFLESAKAEFEAKHKGVTIELNLGHVPTLLTQLEGGVPGDVLVTPDGGTMGQATSKKLLSGDPAVIARIPMALVVPRGNAARVKDVAGLGDELFRVAICAAELPCGKLAQQLAAKASITLKPDTLEPGGSPAIVTKASSGEIDVGLVFATDIAAGGAKVEKIAIPDADNVSSEITVATLKASSNAPVAAAFVAELVSPGGAKLAATAEFLPR
jgi:molybdate transport system substrate-binding protein